MNTFMLQKDHTGYDIENSDTRVNAFGKTAIPYKDKGLLFVMKRKEVYVN